MASRSAAQRTSALPPAASTALPPYEKPSHPLTPRAQRELNAVLHSNRLQKLKERHRGAQDFIKVSAAKINDQLRERDERVSKQNARRQKQNLEPNDESRDIDRKLAQLKQQVDGMTIALEKGMRGAIDGEISVDTSLDSLRWLGEIAGPQTAQEYQSQLSQRQTQAPSSRAEHEGSSPGPTPLGSEGITLTGISELYQNRLRGKRDVYLALPLAARYTGNNDYVSFKRLVHDARYGDDGPALPPPRSWFTDRGSPAPGFTLTQHRNDSDDDVAIERETISTRCPITLQNFKDPVTSTKCPHSFEKGAILQMIQQSSARIGSRGTEKAVQCPVAGCDQVRGCSAPSHKWLC